MTEYERKMLELERQKVREIRRIRYEQLKASGNLALKPAMGRGMPEVPSFEEWNGCHGRKIWPMQTSGGDITMDSLQSSRTLGLLDVYSR